MFFDEMGGEGEGRVNFCHTSTDNPTVMMTFTFY